MTDYSDDDIRRILLEHLYFYNTREICERWGITRYRLRKWKEANAPWRSLPTFLDTVLAGMVHGEWRRPAELIPYLDYRDHAIYTEEQIQGFFEALEARGKLQREGDRWRYVETQSPDGHAFIF